MRNAIGEFLIHLGWAIWGQECDCGHNPFNGLARFIARFLPDRESEEMSRFERATWHVGDLIYRAGMSLHPEM